MDISLIYNSKDKVSELIILLEFSSYKSFFTPRVKIALESLPKFDIDNHKGKEREKQIVSDGMYNHNDNYLKFCILRSIVLTIQNVCRLDFLQIPRRHCGENTITSSKTIVNSCLF